MTEPNNLQDNYGPLEISLEPFYTDILSKKFTTSVEAIDYCRKLCARFGFTIKQEQSTYRNIYVYCSREGFPDSLRNPKSNPKRRRPSKRCDCRWRIVLNEQNETWHFRKSLNPDASKHNHDLMRPEEIDKGWPKEMLDLICELARQRLPTPDIRTRVQLLYAHVPWNERRFYNRLSEERQKQRIRDASHRVQQLCGIWSNLVTAAAASQELTDLAQIDLRRIVDKLCGMTQTDSSTFPLSQAAQKQQQRQDGGGDGDYDNDDDTNRDDSADDHYDLTQPSSSSQDPMDTTGDSSQDESTKPSSLNSRKQGSKSATHQDTPKGYTAVTVPQQIYYVKLHPHRVLQDVQQLHRRRSRSLAFSDEFNNDIGPTGDDPSFNNQLKKQKTPMLMEMAQQQHTQPPPPPDMQSALSARPFDTQHQHHFQQQPPPSNLSVNDPSPSSGYMYHRDASGYPSTSYPVYQQQQPLMPPPSRYMVDTNNNRQQHHQAMSMYTAGRPPLLTVTPDFQQHQQNMASSVPMTPPSSSSPSPHPGRMIPPPPPPGVQTNISMLSTDTTTTSPKDAMLPVINQDPSSASTPTPQQPLTRPPPPTQHQQPTYVLDHHGQQQFTSFYRPPPPPSTYPSLQQQQQQQDEHQQRIYYSNLPNHLLPIGGNNSNNNNTPASSQPLQGMYYMKQPHLPPSQ